MNFPLAARLPLFLVHLAALSSAASAQTTWYVDVAGTAPGSGTASDPYTSIQFAIGTPATQSGDTLYVLPGTYVEQIDFLGKNLVVRSAAGASSTVIRGTGSPGAVVSFHSGEALSARLDGFRVSFGNGGDGGGIFVSGASPTLRNLVVEQNSAFRGGGIYFANSHGRVLDSTIRGNSNFAGGGGFGLGIYADPATAAPTVTDCTLENNGLGSSGHEGGGVFGPGTYTRCTIRGNRAGLGGGVRGAAGLRMIECVISGNQAATPSSEVGLAGGVQGPAELVDCVIDGNSSNQGGGARQAMLTGCQVSNNGADNGYNYTPPQGGGAYQCTLVECVVFGNVASSSGTPVVEPAGGGLFDCTATRCEVYDNRVRTDYPFALGLRGGAGAANSTLVECSIHANRTIEPSFPPDPLLRGGGILGGSATRCTIFANVSQHGGGASDATLVNCTLFGNSAAFGGGVSAMLTPTSLTNCIVWGNLGGDIEIAGGAFTASYCDVQGGAAGTGNFALDPLFVNAAADDFRLQPGSPCINTGDPAAALDADGSRVDVGAVPYTCPPTIYCTGKMNSQGCVPAIASRGTLSLSGTDDFVVTGSGFINQKNGILFWGRGSASTPFQGGTLCVQGPLMRTVIQNSGGTALPPANCSGTYAFAFTHAYLAAAGLHANDTVYAQWYSRDPAIGDGTGASLSNAISFTLCP